MKLGRLSIGTWDVKEPGVIWWEYHGAICGCKFLTVCNVLFWWQHKKCKPEDSSPKT